MISSILFSSKAVLLVTSEGANFLIVKRRFEKHDFRRTNL